MGTQSPGQPQHSRKSALAVRAGQPEPVPQAAGAAQDVRFISPGEGRLALVRRASVLEIHGIRLRDRRP